MCGLSFRVHMIVWCIDCSSPRERQCGIPSLCMDSWPGELGDRAEELRLMGFDPGTEKIIYLFIRLFQNKSTCGATQLYSQPYCVLNSMILPRSGVPSNPNSNLLFGCMRGLTYMVLMVAAWWLIPSLRNWQNRLRSKCFQVHPVTCFLCWFNMRKIPLKWSAVYLKSWIWTCHFSNWTGFQRPHVIKILGHNKIILDWNYKRLPSIGLNWDWFCW